MQKRTQQIIIWIWIVHIMLASVGVHLERVYCYCTGKTTVSLFVADDDGCQQHTDDITMDCCAAPIIVPVTQLAAQDACCVTLQKSGCTKVTSEFFKWQGSFLVEKESAATPDLKLSDFVPPAAVYQFVTTAQVVVRHHLSRPPPEPAPPPSGRTLCIRHACFRC
jgi:hypothetical protein